LTVKLLCVCLNDSTEVQNLVNREMKEPEKNFDKAIEFAEKNKEESLKTATNKMEKDYLANAFDKQIQELKERKKKFVDHRELIEKKKNEEIEKRKQNKIKN
jgi:hypothetical protein